MRQEEEEEEEGGGGLPTWGGGGGGGGGGHTRGPHNSCIYNRYAYTTTQNYTRCYNLLYELKTVKKEKEFKRVKKP
jgi:hypothetical protein